MTLLIYVQELTPRVSYTFRHICKRLLGIEIDFTSKIETFIAHDGAKFSYGKQPLGKELFFQSCGLLFQYGFDEVEVKVQDWEATKCFFSVKNQSAAIPFDIFSASFYLLSRYEEYLPHVKDDLGRFIATESLAYEHQFLEEPVIDIWAKKLKKVLIEKYPDLNYEAKAFTIKPVWAVTQTFAYAQKGILRSIGGSLKDVYKLDFSKVLDRVQAAFGLKKDPFDTFDILIELQKKKKRNTIVFFGLGNYSNYEKNINHNNQLHRKLIKHISDYVNVGLRISFEAISQLHLLKIEKQRIEGIFHKELKQVFCAYHKIKLPEAYRNFVDQEISEDYSMAFDHLPGFRAGTCSPFFFYDLDYEVQTPLLINSPCIIMGSKALPQDQDLLKSLIIEYVRKIRDVQGTFIPVFNNALFSNLVSEDYWKSILEYIWFLEDDKNPI